MLMYSYCFWNYVVSLKPQIGHFNYLARKIYDFLVDEWILSVFYIFFFIYWETVGYL